jgi:hypothetical protein
MVFKKLSLISPLGSSSDWAYEPKVIKVMQASVNNDFFISIELVYGKSILPDITNIIPF